ncbi:hypothetical protein SAMN05421593_2927 [Chryseobacterium culicis]|uniref:Uncharacterized protein n=1 Tax=Chryseobacterium culicis TaxID=680127 RepID=A0A1H6HM96_CHRCI|nr:hypothetical protein SAMN05421593_2927 [Chryseobacterium culicis]
MMTGLFYCEYNVLYSCNGYQHYGIHNNKHKTVLFFYYRQFEVNALANKLDTSVLGLQIN